MSRADKLSDISTSPPAELVVFDERSEAATDWQPIGDPIMGGCSEGKLVVSSDGFAEFRGTVRADNGGGFASIKRDLPVPVDASGFEGIELLAKGDGRTYKIGLRNTTNRNRVVFQQSFAPEANVWTRIRLPFGQFVPTWRGRVVPDAEPLNCSELASLSVFVSGGQYGDFQLGMKNWVLY